MLPLVDVSVDLLGHKGLILKLLGNGISHLWDDLCDNASGKSKVVLLGNILLWILLDKVTSCFSIHSV